MTARDLISTSARLIGALAEGESLSAQGAVDALAALNRMLSSWSTQRLLIYAIVRELFPLVGGTQTYTMGIGADFDTSRPLRLERAGVQIANSGQTTEYPLRIATVEQWAEIVTKDVQSSFPRDVYPEGTYPNETLNFWPVPAAVTTVALYSRKELSSIPLLNTDISFPPGYEEALVYNLAIRLAPEYGKAIPDSVAMMGSDSLAVIKAMNHKPRFLEADNALLQGGMAGRGSYDIYRGGP